MSALTPDRWRAASVHLDDLLDATAEERAAKVAALEASDPQVAADVSTLLASHEAAVGRQFLESPPLPPPGSGPGPGAIVGTYRIVSLIGHGGMGSVWRAERADGRFEGLAAIKVLNSGFMNPVGERRFRREGTILARLTHPHIARLIDAGVTDAGRPFLVLEFVTGQHIDDHCRTHALSADATLRLFLDVLTAVAHAHANLIVHRDLKPSNVLVTDAGQVKLLDFGIATLMHGDATDPDAGGLRTRDPGGLTPRYASPEQMLGRPVTTATDVYALGVLLYGLLAGQHPAGDGPLAPADLVRSIVTVEPPPVSAASSDPVRRRRLTGDVDRIVAKALAKDPAARYDTVNAFADDIRRFLRHEPIAAQPDTWRYRTARFMRRRRRALSVAAVVLMAATGLTTYYGVQLRRERDRATLEAQKAQRVSQLLTGLLRGADPYRDPGPEGPTVLDLLDAGAGRVDAELADQPDARAEILTAIGRVYQRVGRADQAQPILERAVALGRSLPGEGTVILAQALNDLGVMAREGGDMPRSRALLEESLALRRRLLGPRHQDVAITLVELARTLDALGLTDQSEAPIREALSIRQEVFGEEHRETATSKNQLALLLLDRGELAEAEGFARQNLATSRAVLTDRHPNVASAQANLGLVLSAAGRHAEAEALIRSALAIHIETLGADHVNVAHTHHNLSLVVLEQGRTAEAVALARTAVDRGRARLASDHPRLATFAITLGRALLAQRRPAEALPLLEHAYAVRQRSLPPGNWRIGQAAALLGAVLSELRRSGEAEPLLVAADQQLADVPGPQGRDKQANAARLAALAAPRR
jgi:serine/threonine protein kinase